MHKTFRSEILQYIAADIKDLRKSAGLSLADVAMMTNLSMDVITAIEKGRDVSYEKYRHLLRLYDKKLELKIINLA